ncbi:iron-sulfur cluster repair di-iron protein [Cereibacter sphaeroides]|uniref:iron-sulfur cluster repair di-iron protein n=1 Tax=Rhodobacterales TaxID=204455 RepID=UPI000BBE6676|nr:MULTISPECIES: iron-sulfur cluster repair di-iron protein [Paracoccaceae]MCE6949826.1 iron-sulfur cluster repair di-iron protein [Cereibacter sphaeroides]MCE6958984.1 iron-sulfur cluster repair di-iron protein [Cereibacter sphaeroides]MCE6973674.1 iron-sulfur cluster repair di-iron protein [Cereibacter sphaeroides]
MTDISLTLDSEVGEIAAGLPGAAGLFRRHGISFCCGGGLSLAEAAAKHGLSAQALLAELQALAAAAGAEAPQETAAIIDHILTRYHETHRRELSDLIPLAEKVEAVHGEHDEAPLGLTELLDSMRYEMEDHMAKEEEILFPMMRMGGNPMIVHPIAVMRDEHASHADQLKRLEHITRGFTPPEGACRSWHALYAGVRKFAEDLVAHMHLENEVLFPRFERPAAA